MNSGVGFDYISGIVGLLFVLGFVLGFVIGLVVDGGVVPIRGG